MHGHAQGLAGKQVTESSAPMRMSVTSPACSKKLRTVSSVALHGMFLMKMVDEPPPPPGVDAAGVAAPVSVFTFFAGLASSCNTHMQ